MRDLVGHDAVEEDVEVESGDVVPDDDVGVDLADLGQEEAEEGALRVHLGDPEALLVVSVQCLGKVERPHLVLQGIN